MKKNIKLIGIILLLVGLVVGTASVTVFIYSSSYFDSLNVITSFSIGIVSLAISGIALIIAIVTYTSIDSVNSISTMEGNVLENPNYTLAYVELVKEYRNCQTEKEFEEKIFLYINHKLKKNARTCMEYTDCIQTVIDHLLWFAYINVQDADCQIKIQSLVNTLYSRYKKLSAISNGTQYLLYENLKLIKYVLNYQSTRQNIDYLNERGELNNIRGKLLANPISQTVYYNYLGLEYRTKAVKLLRKQCNFTGDEYLIEHMKSIQTTKLEEEAMDEVSFYIEKSKEAFKKAITLSEQNLLWSGYINFNLARITFIEFMVFNDIENQNEIKEHWEIYISEAIKARKSVQYIFTDYGESDYSYLISQFKKELYYSEIFKYIFKASTTGLSQQELDRIKEIEKITSNQDITLNKRTNQYCRNLLGQ